MPRVPVPIPGAGEELRPLNSGALRPADMEAGTRMLGDALSGVSQTALAMSDEQMKIDVALDLAAVKKADNEDAQWLRERLWTADDAFFKQQGFNAANARTGLEKAMADRRAAVRATFTSDRQRNMYDDTSTRRYGAESEGIARHANNETMVEARKQGLARITEGSNDAVTYYDDPVRRQQAIDVVDAELVDQARVGGWAPETLRDATRQAHSNITGRTVGMLIDRGQFEDAQAMLERSRGDLDPDTESKLDGALLVPMRQRRAAGIVDDLLGTAPPVETSVVNAQRPGEVLPRMVSITAQAESGGRERNRDGSRVTSPKGAEGIMQVMPGTQRDPGFGIKASNGTPEDDARVGREYLAAMMKRYNNDPAKAWAAYNWGPGNVDQVLKAHPSDWLDFVPDETRKYVRGNLSALGGGRGQAQQQPREHNVTELLARVDGLNLDFDTEQEVRRQIMQRVGVDEGLLQRDRQKAEEDAWGVVEPKGKAFTDTDQIPRPIWRRLTPQQRMQFDGVAERNRNTGKETNWGQYSTYSDEFATNPEAFLKRSPSELRANLSDGEFEQVMGWRRALQAGRGSMKPPEQVTHSRIRDVTDPILVASGIQRPEGRPGKPRDQAADAAYARRVGQFQWSVAYDVEVWQRKHPNEQISDNQIQDIANSQLIRMYRKDEQGNKSDAGFAFETGDQQGLVAEIPTATRNKIREQYRQRFGYYPSESQVWEVYRYGARGGRR